MTPSNDDGPQNGKPSKPSQKKSKPVAAMKPITVVMADDYPVVRSGIKSILQLEPDIQVIGETGNGLDVIPMVMDLRPNVLLLDIEMPGITGIEITRRLRSNNSRVRILALSGYDDKHYIMHMLELGASGYLIKDEVPDTIAEAVRGVAHGQTGWLSRKVAAQVSAWMLDESRTPRLLTPREIDVLKYLSRGMTNQAIGKELGISEKTVEKYLDSVFKKLGVTSRVKAAVLAVREGLIR